MAEIAVAPFMGAWIETFCMHAEENELNVAPFMGAWIETKLNNEFAAQSKSRSLHGSVD